MRRRFVNAKELIKEGRLVEARKSLVEEVKRAPGNSGARTLLFQVLAFLGEWEKAARHLDAIALQAGEANAGIESYKKLVQAEQERLKVIRLAAVPSFLPDTPEYFPLYRDALEKLQGNKPEEAQALYQQIDAQLEDLTGTVNGNEFKSFTNPDASLTYFLEIFAHEHHIYVPYETIRELLVQTPTSFFDLIWPQATLTTWGGLSLNCFLPALYPESFLQDDPNIKMGKATDWLPMGGHFIKGIGQQVFNVDGEDMAILEIREIQFNLSSKQENNE